MVQFLVIAQTASFKCVKCCYFSIPVPCRRPCPWGSHWPPTQSLDMDVTRDGLGLQGGAACLELDLRQKNSREPLFPPDGSAFQSSDESLEIGTRLRRVFYQLHYRGINILEACSADSDAFITLCQSHWSVWHDTNLPSESSCTDTDAQDFSGNAPFLDLKLITLCFVEGCGVVLFSFSFFFFYFCWGRY